MPMTVRGRVKNGRLIVDVQTELPEGTELELVSVDAPTLLPDEEDGLVRALESLRAGHGLEHEQVRARIAKHLQS